MSLDSYHYPVILEESELIHDILIGGGFVYHSYGSDINHWELRMDLNDENNGRVFVDCAIRGKYKIRKLCIYLFNDTYGGFADIETLLSCLPEESKQELLYHLDIFSGD